MHFPMVVNWREKKECGHDAKEGADMDSVHSAVPLKSVGLNLLYTAENEGKGQNGTTISLYKLNEIKACNYHPQMKFRAR